MKKHFQIGLLLFPLIFVTAFLSAQSFNFINYTATGGLASSSINYIFQDSRGYIWFATQGGGVSRFNGREFENFTRSKGLISNNVTYITEDKRGHIWIATAQGVSEFDGIRFTNYGKKEGLTDGIVYCVYADSANKIWMALQSGGIKIKNGSHFDSLTVKDGIPPGEAYTILQDNKGNYWFGLSNGLVQYSNGKVIDYSSLKILHDKSFFSSYADGAGNIWFGSSSGDVIAINQHDSITRLELPAHLSKDFIGGITRDKQGNFWFATDHGLLKYDGKAFKLFGEHEGLSVNSVQSVMTDYENNIWASTLTGGANMLSGESFFRYTDKDGLACKNVTCICAAPNSDIRFIGTGEGLYEYNPAARVKIRKVIEIKDLAAINISSLSTDSAGRLWISALEGIFVVNPSSHPFSLVKKITRLNGQNIISPLKLINDNKGNCWIATYGTGIIKISSTGATFYNRKNGFISDKILTVFEDRNSNIWFGTEDQGVIVFDGKNFAPGPVGNLHHKSVWSITGDAKGDIFFGTGESGLFCYNGKTTCSYDVNNNILADYVPSVQWDKFQNCLWIAGERGLERLKFAGNKISENHIYNRSDGFRQSSFNQNGIWIDDIGALWLCTVEGLWRYNKKADFPKKAAPKIELADVRLFYKKTDWQKFADSINPLTNLPVNLVLPYSQNHLTFDLQALTTANVSYTCKLDGFDEQWSAPSKINQITYSNINPGQTYTFRAKAVNNDGHSSHPVLFAFTITPPWWNTWLFRISAAVFLALVLIVIIKARERVLKMQNLKLEGTVKQRTEEIEQQKKLVEEKNENITQQKAVVEKTLVEKELLLKEKEVLMKEIHHRVKNNLQTISSMLMLQGARLVDEKAKSAIAESQSRVRSIALVHQKLYQSHGFEKVELNGFINDLIAEIKTMYGSMTKNISIHKQVQVTDIIIDTAIPLGLILNELLTNSFKYAFVDTNAGEIFIDIQFIPGIAESANSRVSKKVRLIYRDTGPGFDYTHIAESKTLGLRLIRLLSQQINAALNYSNKNGSEFEFLFAINIL